MGEILDGPVQRTARAARERLTRAVHDLDPRKKEASVTLFQMREAMREVPITRLPKALEITIGGRTYVSTRVMD